jgi:hypothetical protein
MGKNAFIAVALEAEDFRNGTSVLNEDVRYLSRSSSVSVVKIQDLDK